MDHILMIKINNVKHVKLSKDNILIKYNISVKNAQINKYIIDFYKYVKTVKLNFNNFIILQLINVRVVQ